MRRSVYDVTMQTEEDASYTRRVCVDGDVERAIAYARALEAAEDEPFEVLGITQVKLVLDDIGDLDSRAAEAAHA